MQRRLNYGCVVPLISFTLLFPQIASGASPTIPSGRAMWVWSGSSATILSSPTEMQKFFDFCNTPYSSNDTTKKILTVYFAPPDVNYLIPQSQKCDQLRNFLSEAHSQSQLPGFRVECLLGRQDHAWATPSLEPQGEQYCTNAIVFNTGTTDPVQRFDGIHFDVEPDSAAGWKENAQLFWQTYLTLLTNCKAKVDTYNNSYPPITFAADISPWFDDCIYQFIMDEYTAIQTQMTHYVTIMDYDDCDSNMVASAKQELSNGPCFIGVETNKVIWNGINIQTSSFYEEGRDILEQVLGTASSDFSNNYPNHFKGITIEDYDGYQSLASQKPANTIFAERNNPAAATINISDPCTMTFTVRGHSLLDQLQYATWYKVVDGSLWELQVDQLSGFCSDDHCTYTFSNRDCNQICVFVTDTANHTSDWTTWVVNFPAPSGSLQVTLGPSGAVSAGAQWNVDGGFWKTSGTPVSGLSVGQHTVYYYSIPGWTEPSTESVTINNCQTTSISRNYIQQTYTISGNTGVGNVILNGLGTSSDSGGNYSATVSYGWNGTVTPSETGYTFSPLSRTYSTVTSNQTSQNYTATLQTYTISGYIRDSSNNGISAVTLVANNGGGSVTTDSSGSYSITVSYGWSGTVTPSKAGYYFKPSFIGYSSISSNKTNQNYTLAPVPVISGISPNNGPPGTYMTITGTDFGDNPGTVLFAENVTGEEIQWFNSIIYCRVPSGAIIGSIFVVNADRISNAPNLDPLDPFRLFFWTTNPTTIYVNLNHVPYIENGTTQYPFSTIQRGIDAASNGATVIVANGTYTGDGNHNIDFMGKAITVCSQNGPEYCIIDCQNLGCAFSFHSNENLNSVLDGFKIINGNGGAIVCSSSPLIANCIVSGNRAGAGAGIYIESNNNPTVISNCTITNNKTEDDGVGAGILVDYGKATITNCTISDNNSDGHGGGITLWGGSIGTITNCTITGNTAGGPYLSWGGGVLIFSNNYATIANCIITGNMATGVGGGVCFINTDDSISESDVNIISCTITHNTAQHRGGGVYCQSTYGFPINATIENCIIWDNNWNEISIQGPNSLPTVNFCDVNGGWSAGEGNIDSDPCFADADDYRLRSDSPCIDAGDPNFIANSTSFDIDGRPRVIGGRIDIGAYEFSSIADFDFSDRVDFKDLFILASDWLQASPVADIAPPPSGDGIVNFLDFALFAQHWLEGSEPLGDLNSDKKVDLYDYAKFSTSWYAPCSSPSWCNGADFDHSGRVDFADLLTFAQHWLQGVGQ
jgi:hypothetical protein